MPQGKVIDPVGQQSTEYDFGYFRRKDLDWPEEEQSKPRKKKAIPFLNRDENGDRIFTKNSGPFMEIYPVKAIVYQVEDKFGDPIEPKELGTIGIALFDPPE